MKSIILQAKNYNYGEIQPGDWEKREWNIYDDLSVDFYETYNSVSGKHKKTINYNLTREQYEMIIKNIDLEKFNNMVVNACDGDAWEFIKYHNDVEVLRIGPSYIYGIPLLEEVASVLNAGIRH